VLLGTVKSWRTSPYVVSKEIDGVTYYQFSTLPRTTIAKLPYKNVEAALDAAKLIANNQQQVEVAHDKTNLGCELRQARENWPDYFDTYVSAYDKEWAVRYAKAHAVFARRLELTAPDASPRRTHKELQGPFRALKLDGFCTRSQQYFSRQLKWCARNGIAATLLHSNLGNDNALKTGTFHKYRTEAYHSLPYKYSCGTVALLVNYECAAHGLPEVSESWVKQFLAQPNVKNRLAKSHHGLKYFTDRIQSYVERTTALHANDLWQADGSPLQFFCWNADRTKKIRLTLFVILDVYSRKIVGYDLSPDRRPVECPKRPETSYPADGYGPV